MCFMLLREKQIFEIRKYMRARCQRCTEIAAKTFEEVLT